MLESFQVDLTGERVLNSNEQMVWMCECYGKYLDFNKYTSTRREEIILILLIFLFKLHIFPGNIVI